jgi:hypothetical protein
LSEKRSKNEGEWSILSDHDGGQMEYENEGKKKEATWDDEKTEKVKTHEDDEFNGGKLSKNGANWSKNERKRSKNERKRTILSEKMAIMEHFDEHEG